ncbi:jg3104 [Pararge aegeria aegeria]|uniref:Jg3104 protein n=1 Tax=Pararge aegeria aegeria TaxID=348720 RepID=A0A8S4R1J5_9NEOP|nr:jg3104 [Pararge aegeria aegeria]
MEYVKLFVTIFIFYVSNISFAQLEDDNCYAAIFTEGTKDCDDFQNDIFICSLNIEIAPENDEGTNSMLLYGFMEVKEDLGEEYEVQLNVWKDIGTGLQFMYSIEGNLCDSLKRDDTPWKPMVEALKTSDCPVATGVYPVKNMTMSLDFAENVMNHEFCGDYLTKIIIMTLDKQISCYQLSIAVEEVPCE